MSDIINAGAFTLTVGIDHGRNHIYVTHRESGKQWMSKSPLEGDRDMTLIAKNIELGITTFNPDATIKSCDTRFWFPVNKRN